MAKFFINRPIFAAVISVIITLAGGIAVMLLPVAQYPEITPPTVQVSCTYPGASAKVVAETVAAPIEQQVIGVENMLYMSSQCTNDGGYNLTVTFEVGTNLDMAQVLVQNRVNLALPTLPSEVKQTGVSVKKKSPSILLVVNLVSPEGNVRSALSQQLRHDPTARRAGPGQRRRRCDVSRTARLQHARLARSRIAWPPEICRPATSSPPCANKTCKSPPDRSAVRRCRRARRFNTRSARWGD